MENEISKKQRIINCHSHIFTGNHVPPYLAKTILLWPFYYLTSVSLIISILRFWYKGPYTWQFKGWYKQIVRNFYHFKIFILRHSVLNALKTIIGTIITLNVFFIICDSFLYTFDFINASNYTVYIEQLRGFCQKHHLYFTTYNISLKLLLVAILILFIPTGRNLILLILKRIWRFSGLIPKKETQQLLARYISIGRFARYESQSGIFGRLKNQYPEGTCMIVLPMDMEYMGAGKLKIGNLYRDQIKELAKLKKDHPNIIYPFVFADPRRIKEEPNFFDYHLCSGTMKVENCFIKEYIEENKFSGFKIYPALGYYPFDEKLLPLLKYAADNEIPIITHCIRGIIYYRGNKEREWDEHPVFEQSIGGEKYEPLLLPEMKNKDFTNNFTHPLNYLCLLEETLLRKLVQNAKDNKVRELFGYTNENTPLESNLRNLKICFGHYGGDDEWKRFFELDRDNYASQLVKHPTVGINFLENLDGENSRAKLEQIWKYTDWYSIISSLILQYPNVYADISYILHNAEVLPLLKQTLCSEKLRTRILYGTDFYVVRNHKSDKNMLADICAGLKDADFDLIARENPTEFLYNGFHGYINSF